MRLAITYVFLLMHTVVCGKASRNDRNKLYVSALCNADQYMFASALLLH